MASDPHIGAPDAADNSMDRALVLSQITSYLVLRGAKRVLDLDRPHKIGAELFIIPAEGGPVPLLVSRVVCWRVVPKVVEPVVRGVAVVMAALLAVRAWPDKGRQNQCSDVVVPLHRIQGEASPRSTVGADRRAHHFALLNRRVPVGRAKRLIERAHAATITNLVKPFIAWDGFP